MGMNGDPDEKLEFCLSEAKENCDQHTNDDLVSNNEISFTKNGDSKEEIQQDEPENENVFIPDEDESDEKRVQYLKILNNFMKEESNSHNMILKGKIISIVDALPYNKGIVITGPRCTGKTSIIKGLGYLLKNSDANIEMRISILNPDVYNLEKLYGTAESGVMNPEISTNEDVKISSISSTVLGIATKGFELISEKEETDSQLDENEEIEKHIEVSSQDSQSEEVQNNPKLLKTLLFESSAINPLWSD